MSFGTDTCFKRRVWMNLLQLKQFILCMGLRSFHCWFNTEIGERNSSSMRELSGSSRRKRLNRDIVSWRRQLWDGYQWVCWKHFSVELRDGFFFDLRQVNEWIGVNGVSLRRTDLKRSNVRSLLRMLSTWESFWGEWRFWKSFISQFSIDIRYFSSINRAQSWYQKH